MTGEADRQTELKPPEKLPNAAERAVDPRDLVRTEGYPQNPQEVIENPAVAPQMLNAPGDLRGDLMDED